MQKMSIRLEGSGCHYLEREKDNRLTFHLSPNRVNVYQNVMGDIIHKYNMYDISLDHLFGASIMRGLDDNSQEQFISFTSIKECCISSYQGENNQTLEIVI